MVNTQAILQLKDGRNIGYAEYGNPQGKPIFYFHGFPSSRLEAGHFHEIALSKQYRLIGLDRPGMGLSSPHKDRNILSWVSDVTEFADALNIEKFSIVAHSGGAPFAAACAYQIPDRLNGVAIVSGMAPFERSDLKARMSFGEKCMNMLIGAFPWLSKVMMLLTRMGLNNSDGFIMSQTIKTLPEVDQVYFNNLEQKRAMINASLEAFKEGVSGPAQEINLLFKPWGFELEKIKCPLKIWHGSLDSQAPFYHAETYKKAIPHAELNIVEGEAHHSVLRNNIKSILKSIR